MPRIKPRSPNFCEDPVDRLQPGRGVALGQRGRKVTAVQGTRRGTVASPDTLLVVIAATQPPERSGAFAARLRAAAIIAITT